MSSLTKQIRKAFRDAVFTRDGYRCTICGLQSSAEKAEEELDAHHITNRNEMPHGGYVASNGITLCKSGCHELAEEWLTTGAGGPGLSPEDLYRLIGSSREAAEADSRELE